MERGQITLLLGRAGDGDQDAAKELFAAVYDHLRRVAGAQMSKSKPDHTLTPQLSQCFGFHSLYCFGITD